MSKIDIFENISTKRWGTITQSG